MIEWIDVALFWIAGRVERWRGKPEDWYRYSHIEVAALILSSIALMLVVFTLVAWVVL